ncbi:hypothetical protein V1515DRAFT_581329 [Lipomyces mesembrius]
MSEYGMRLVEEDTRDNRIAVLGDKGFRKETSECPRVHTLDHNYVKRASFEDWKRLTLIRLVKKLGTKCTFFKVSVAATVIDSESRSDSFGVNTSTKPVQLRFSWGIEVLNDSVRQQMWEEASLSINHAKSHPQPSRALVVQFCKTVHYFSRGRGVPRDLGLNVNTKASQNGRRSSHFVLFVFLLLDRVLPCRKVGNPAEIREERN